MNSNERKDWIFDYDLSAEIRFSGKVVNSPAVTFKKTDKYVTGFTIAVKDSVWEHAEKMSNNKAQILKNILTIKSGKPVNVNLRGYQSVSKSGHPTQMSFDFIITGGGIEAGFRDLDLNDPHIESIMTSSESRSLVFEYASKGFFHYYNGNPVDCIKDLFKTVENHKEFPEHDKYKSLRDIFSHKPPYKKETVNLFRKYFGLNTFAYKIFHPVDGWIIIDLESKENIRLLNGIAKEFMIAIRKHLNLPKL